MCTYIMCMQINTHANKYTCIYIHAHIHTHMHTFPYTYIHTQKHMNLAIQKDTHIDTYTHIDTDTHRDTLCKNASHASPHPLIKYMHMLV